MIVELDPASSLPPYEQVRSQVETMIISGVLPKGAQLPTIRQLAKDLGLAGGTVSRAYKELGRKGLIKTRVAHDSFVSGSGRPPKAAVDEQLGAAAKSFALQVRRLGVEWTRALRQAQEALKALEG